MKFKEAIAYFMDRYSLLAMLILAAILLLVALVGLIALICQAPGWKAIGWLGIVGIIIVLVAIGWGIYDEIRTIRKMRR